MISKDFDFEITPDEYLKASCPHMDENGDTFIDDEGDGDYVICSICSCRLKKNRIERRKDLPDIVKKLIKDIRDSKSKIDKESIDKEVF